jgi:hypothetical protein
MFRWFRLVPAKPQATSDSAAAYQQYVDLRV